MTEKKKTEKAENPMRKIKIEKVVLSCGGKEAELVKGAKLLSLLSGMKAQIIKSAKRIPDFDVRPGLEVGARATLRGKKAAESLKGFLAAIDNSLNRKKVAQNHFSFGIKEYIEIPGIEYQRDIGIKGLNVAVDFIRSGLRVKRRKIKTGKVSPRQYISKQEIIKFMEENFKTQFV